MDKESKKGCENCGIQVSLKEDFHGFGQASLQVKRLELLEKHCLNCADNSFADRHNWTKITKAQRRKIILKHAPKEIQPKLLSDLDKKKKRG